MKGKKRGKEMQHSNNIIGPTHPPHVVTNISPHPIMNILNIATFKTFEMSKYRIMRGSHLRHHLEGFKHLTECTSDDNLKRKGRREQIREQIRKQIREGKERIRA